MLLDLVSLIAFVDVYFTIGTNVRILNLLIFLKTIRVLKNLNKYNEILDSKKNEIFLSFIRLWKIFILVLVIAHAFACI